MANLKLCPQMKGRTLKAEAVHYVETRIEAEEVEALELEPITNDDK